MKPKSIHCEECVENIPSSEWQWEDGKLYCARCGSELSPSPEDRDLLDDISSGRPRRLFTLEDDKGDEEEEDEDEDDFEDEDEDGFEDDEEEEDEEELEEEEGNGNGRPPRRR